MDEAEKNTIRQTRKIVTAEAGSIVLWSWLFAKLVVFNHYRRFNMPLKLALTFVYAATIEPVSVAAGYFVYKANPTPSKSVPAFGNENDNV